MSAKVVGIFSWVPVGPPKLTIKDYDVSITASYTGSLAELPSKLPEIGSGYADFRYPFFTGWAVILRDIVVTPKAGGTHCVVELTYSSPDDASSESGDDDVRTEIEYTTQDTDVPLGQHPGYLVCWDHKLLKKLGSSPPTAADWWATAKTTKIAGSEAEYWKWLYADDQLPEGWEIAKDEKKPARNYRSGVTTVTETKRCRNVNRLARDAEKDYTIQTPPKTFGRSGQWLRGGSSIRKEGKDWVLTVSYLNSKKVDEDIYTGENLS